MADLKQRDLERLASQGDPEARLRLLRERARGGDKDALMQWSFEISTWDLEYRRLVLQTPYLQACTRHGFPPNHFSATKEQGTYTNLGETVIVKFFRWRPAALHITDDGKRESFDLDSDLFKEIYQLSLDRHTRFAMTGPQFLVWVPAIEEVLSWFCFSRSSKRILSDFNPPHTKLIGQVKELFVREIQTSRHTWWTTGIQDEHAT